jgi:putative heme-binding domain-containing protein
MIITHIRSLAATALVALAAASSQAGPMSPVPETLVAVTNPPPVQMLIPGFVVRELPLDLNNINCLVCAPDGRIFALCYDGNVLQLTATNHDGLEDSVSYFFKNDHRDLPPSIGMCWGPGGLYIASHGRVARLRDKGDGTGELETVATGWVGPTIGAGSAIDCYGIAVDKDGKIFFGLGCDAWSNPYLTNGAGGSGYHLNSDRGTIQEVSADWKQRTTVATGVRFTVALAFNAAGDLFCTDQEGATWLPNGNPFDELLNIQPGRHYGFPPRHPQFLPNVIDEPSVFDYGPQHQSTCGLHFDNPVGGGTEIFGPAWWRDNAIIPGESRGKLWRTKLVKTPAGYVAQNNLIGCLTMLAIDAMPTPQGDLLICCHSGRPDWGAGPEAKGKLFKISYAAKSAPQPVFAHATSPSEICVTFDRPLDPAQFKNLTAQASISMGKYVTAGNRFESFHPNYPAVDRQLAAPRYRMPVLSAGLTSDNCSIVLETTPHTQAVNYAVTLPYAPGSDEPARKDPYHDIDVLSDLTGVDAQWKDSHGKVQWTGWLPHFDLTVARAFTPASAEHRRLFELLQKRGTLTLRGKLDLWSMLHPAIQPGGQIGFEYPPETVTVVLKASGKLNVKTSVPVRHASAREAAVTLIDRENQWLPLTVELPTGPAVGLDVSWFTDEDPRPRAMPLRRVLMPWAMPAEADPAPTGPRQIPELAGGDWARGKRLFFSEQPGCYKCHQAGGQGGRIGPDLSTVLYRDYSSVLKDIMEPSAAINPDYVASNITLKDGDIQTGIILRQDASHIVLGQVTGQSLEIPREDIADIKASKVSLMPEGLLKGMSAQQRRDLLTFLMTVPPGDGKN